jgi:hypothetical protein
MSVEIRRADGAGRWNDLVRQSDDTTAFHLAEALDVLADESGSTVHRLVGYKGEEPCGLFPVFTTSVGPFALAFSPPPDLKVPYLGPALLNTGKLKRRRLELRHGRFIDAAVEWLRREHGPSFATVRTAPGYDDARPLIWNDYEATPRYTYLVDLTRGPEELLSSFSTDARRNVTATHDVDHDVVQGGHDGIDDVVAGATDRHAEQGEPFPIDAAFVRRLYDALPDGVMRPQLCLCDGDFVGGQLTLEFNGTGVSWLAVSDYEADLPVSDVLDWAYITDAADRGVETYDLAGANNRRLSRYKAKFAGELTPYYRAESGSRPMVLASRLYGRLR